MSEREELTVHFLPDYTDVNPYQQHLSDALDDRGVTVHTTGGGDSLFPILAAARETRPDVLHVHFLHQFVIASSDRLPRVLSAALAIRATVQLLVLRLLGVSLVWTAHDLHDHERTAPRVEAAFKHVVLRWLFAQVFVHCARAERAMRRAYQLPANAVDVTVTPHGNFDGTYPNEIDRQTARDRLGIETDGTVYGFFGSIRAYKDVPRLVSTFREIARPADRLLIAGNPRTPTLQRAVESAAAGDDRITTVFEYVPREEVQVYLRASDVIVLPFRTTERSLLTSGSALLAMGFGRPVIAPDVGCVGSLVTAGDGFVYDPSADDGLAAAMERARTVPDLDRRSEQSRQTAAEQTWAATAERTHAAYDRIS